MYKCRYFDIQELVSPDCYSDRGDKAWELLDVSMLMGIDQLRDEYGPMIVNDWSTGGRRKHSGLRQADSPFFSPYSQHSFGRAVDCFFLDTTVSKVRKDILENNGRFGICGIELNVNWLHVDWRNCTPTKAFEN